MEHIVIKLSTNELKTCPLCNGKLDGIDNFEKACSHLLNDHNLKCYHVGQETVEGFEGKPLQSTVAVFGNFPLLSSKS